MNQIGRFARLTGCRNGNTEYLIAADRSDLSAFIYKLWRDIEKFFQWRKKHPEVCRLTARSECGVTLQPLSGLITYLLMASCCRKHYNEPVSAVRLRQIRIAGHNELRNPFSDPELIFIPLLSKNGEMPYAKT